MYRSNHYGSDFLAMLFVVLGIIGLVAITAIKRAENDRIANEYIGVIQDVTEDISRDSEGDITTIHRIILNADGVIHVFESRDNYFYNKYNNYQLIAQAKNLMGRKVKIVATGGPKSFWYDYPNVLSITPLI